MLLFLLPVFFQGKTAHAQRRASLKQIECPAVIADAEEGTFNFVGGRKKGKYRCFAKQRDAKKAGFKTKAEVESYDFTGWYRLKLSKVIRDTCSATPAIGGGTFFLQLRQSESGVAGQFCPSIGVYTGYRAGNGFVLSTSEEFDSIGGIDFCGDAEVKKQQFVELQQIVKGSPSFLANYRTHYRCLAGEFSGTTCIREFSGIAFLETHTIWPPVADNIDQQESLCEIASTRCRECHTFLD